MLGKGKGLGACVWISNSPSCVVESKSKLSLTSLVFSLQAFTCYWCCFVLTDCSNPAACSFEAHTFISSPKWICWKKEGMKWENGGSFKFHRNIWRLKKGLSWLIRWEEPFSRQFIFLLFRFQVSILFPFPVFLLHKWRGKGNFFRASYGVLQRGWVTFRCVQGLSY